MEVHAARARWFCRDRPPCLSFCRMLTIRTTTEDRTGTEACPYKTSTCRGPIRTFSATSSGGRGGSRTIPAVRLDCRCDGARVPFPRVVSVFRYLPARRCFLRRCTDFSLTRPRRCIYLANRTSKKVKAHIRETKTLIARGGGRRHVPSSFKPLRPSHPCRAAR